MEDSRENHSDISAHENSWTVFSSAEAKPLRDGSDSSNLSQTKVQPKNESDDPFRDSTSVKQTFSETAEDDAKPMKLFEKSLMVDPKPFLLIPISSTLMACTFLLSSGSVGHQVPRMAMPVTGQHMQNGSNQRMHLAGSSFNFPISSLYTPGQVVPPTIGMKSIGGLPISASPICLTTPIQWGKDYDFSSLTQGIFTKR